MAGQGIDPAQWARGLGQLRAALGVSSKVHLYDEIGPWGVTAAQFAADLKAAGAGDGDLELHLNTPGGDVHDGMAIYNLLRQRAGQVRVVVDGLAASIGSVIAMAASPGQLVMSEGSTMMIHDAFCLTVGDAADHRDAAGVLDKASGNIASAYAARSGHDAAVHRQAMQAETWYTAQEAVDAGLADRTGAVAERAQAAMVAGVLRGAFAELARPAATAAPGAARRRPRGVDPAGRPVTAARKRQALAAYEQLRERRYGRPPEAEQLMASAWPDGVSPFVRQVFGA